jgi:amino acid transporter
MASNNDFGKKGAVFGKIILTIILFIIMLIWIYQKNGHFLPNK